MRLRHARRLSCRPAIKRGGKGGKPNEISKRFGDSSPDSLLRELQKYASGELFYVPADSGRKKWGERSGARTFYQERNEEIRYRHFHLKIPIETLCEEYSLSSETVRKIVYR